MPRSKARTEQLTGVLESVRGRQRRGVGPQFVERLRTLERDLAATLAARKPDGYHILCKRAQRRGLAVSISRAEYKAITASACFYCSDKLPPSGSGVDRISSATGYTLKNCRPSCSVCNNAKRLLSEQEFKTWVKRIHKMWASKRQRRSQSASSRS